MLSLDIQLVNSCSLMIKFIQKHVEKLQEKKKKTINGRTEPKNRLYPENV